MIKISIRDIMDKNIIQVDSANIKDIQSYLEKYLFDSFTEAYSKGKPIGFIKFSSYLVKDDISITKVNGHEIKFSLYIKFVDASGLGHTDDGSWSDKTNRLLIKMDCDILDRFNQFRSQVRELRRTKEVLRDRIYSLDMENMIEHELTHTRQVHGNDQPPQIGSLEYQESRLELEAYAKTMIKEIKYLVEQGYDVREAMTMVAKNVNSKVRNHFYNLAYVQLKKDGYIND